jgi:hypothetical protein
MMKVISCNMAHNRVASPCGKTFPNATPRVNSWDNGLSSNRIIRMLTQL